MFFCPEVSSKRKKKKIISALLFIYNKCTYLVINRNPTTLFHIQKCGLIFLHEASLIQMPGYQKDGASIGYNRIYIPLNSAGKHCYQQGKHSAGHHLKKGNKEDKSAPFWRVNTCMMNTLQLQ